MFHRPESPPTAAASAPGFSPEPEPKFCPDAAPQICSSPGIQPREPQAQEVPLPHPQAGMEPENEPEVDPPTPFLLSEALNNVLFEETDREFEIEPDYLETSTIDFKSKRHQPLYEGSNITYHESMVSVLT